MNFDATGHNDNRSSEDNDFSLSNVEATPLIEVHGSSVLIRNIEMDIPSLAATLDCMDAVERLSYFTSVIMYGTETMQLMNTTATAESLKNVASTIAADIDTKKDLLISSLQEVMTSVISPDSTIGLPHVLKAWRTDFEKALNEEFDPNKTNSIINKFDSLIDQKRDEENNLVVDRLDFNKKDSAVNMLVEKINLAITTEIEKVETRFEDLSTALGIKDATKGVEKKLANRGNTFEKNFFDVVAEISRGWGDTADDPGQQKAHGLEGNDEGDITVSLNTMDLHGESALFVYECKLRANGISDLKALDELDKGIRNRGAKAGVIVTEPRAGRALDEYNFFYPHANNRAILVVDSDDPDVNAIRYSYLWARLKCLESSGKTLSTGLVKESVQKIELEIKNFRQLKSNNTKAKGFLDDNQTLIENIQKSIDAELANLKSLIESAEEDQLESTSAD
jgi:hypothetical protein